MTPPEKIEGFFLLDEFEKALEYVHTKLTSMKTDDYDQMTCLLEEVEKVDELEGAMEVATSNSNFITLYDNLKIITKMKDSQVSRLIALVTIKLYFQYVHDIVIHKKEILATLMKLSEKDVNSLKDRGNNLLENNEFRNAHEMYTEALAIYVFNDSLYINRCQTSLRIEDFSDALRDARRAVTNKPDWQEGHYRYAQAFFELKDIDRALFENVCLQTGDLQQQAAMFVSLNSTKNKVPDLVSESETDSDSDSDCKGKSRKPSKLPDINQDLQKSKQDYMKKKAEEAKKKKEEEMRKEKEVADKKRREQEERERKHQEEQELRRRQPIMHDVEASNKSTEEDERRKVERKNKRKEVEKAERKRKEAEKQAQERLKREEKERHAKEKEKQAKREAEIARQQEEQMRKENERLSKERNAIEKCLADGSLALVSGQSRQAITQYDRAAELLKATNKEHCGMHEADYIVFLYAQATAYLKSGIPREINEALSRFENITKNYPYMRNGLPFYGLATSLSKLNRFTEALDPIEKSLFITTHFDQTIHTWPGTSTNIEETEKGKLEAALKELQRWCKNPPSADATCRYMECTSKREMYLSDLDFKGYIKVQCSERCYIDYHINCWKAIKNESNILGEREALKTKCSTPDCLGTLSNIKVIGANGLIKTEAKVEKLPKPSKDETKKKSAPKPTKDQKKGKKFRKYHQSESSKAQKGQGDAEDQPGHGQTAEGAHAAKEDASSNSVPGATKPRTVLDAGIATATDSTRNDGSSSQMVEGAEGDAEIKPEATYQLKRDEFDDVKQKKTNKAQPKKSRKPAVLHEEASNIVQFDFGPNRRHLYGADDAEELQEKMNRGWQSTLTVSEDRPFAIPGHLQDAAREMDASFHKGASIVVPETDEEKSQKTVLFLHFNDIFSNNGPLHLQDPIITGSMEHLTFVHQELIVKRGGLKTFLRESEDIVVIGDYASMSGDVQKCRELAIRHGYQEREPMGDVAGYTLNPDSVPFIPRTMNSGLSVFRAGPVGDNYNQTLSLSLDQFDDAKRGPVSGLDSFDGDDESNEEDGEDDNEIKTGESEGTKNESDNEDTVTTSSDDDDDDEEDDSDGDNDEAEDSFHDASSEPHVSHYEGIESERYQLTLEGNVTILSDSKVDGIDDEDYHWEDHHSFKELTMEEVDDVVVHMERERNGEQSHVQRSEEGTMGNKGASNNIESKDTFDSAEGRGRQVSLTKLPVPSDFELARDGSSSRQSEHVDSIQSDGPQSVVSVLSDVQESRALEQAEINKNFSEAKMIEYHEAITRRADETIKSLQEKHQKDLDQHERKGKEEKQFKALHQVEAKYLKQYNRLQILEEMHESWEKTDKKFTQLKERYDKLVLAYAEETESLKSEIGILRNSVKDKEKVNKMLELRLKAKEEEAVKSLGRACKAESHFLYLFMSKELTPLDEACKEANKLIKTIANILQRNPMMEEHGRAIRSMWQDCLATNQRAASKALNEFQTQVNAIQNGATLDSMMPVEVPAPYKPEGLVKCLQEWLKQLQTCPSLHN